MSDSERKSIGFVSLGCPKALVNSERILTQLKMDGYDIVPSHGTSVLRPNQPGWHYGDAILASVRMLAGIDDYGIQ